MDHAERFWGKVDRRGPDDCWNWQRGCFSTGYGGFSLNGVNVGAHVVAYELANGPIDPKLCRRTEAVVMHSCDNKTCCNPAHLSLGTQLENNQEIEQRNRVQAYRGRKLKPEQVKAIRNDPRKHKEIAVWYGLHRETVSRIKRRKRWANVE